MNRTITELNLGQFQARMNTVLSNIQNQPEIAAALASFGYDAPKLAEGQEMLAELLRLDASQVKEYGEQYSATQAVNQAWETADGQYEMHRTIAKRLFKGQDMAERGLLLTERKPRTRPDWVRQATIFYQNLLGNAQWVMHMGRFGRTQAELQLALAAVQQVQRLEATQTKELGEAQAATEARDDQWAACRAWLAGLMEVAEFALLGRPQLLESLQKTVY
jgi:hypothetical protein